MDDRRFDDLTRTLVAGVGSRRAITRQLLGAALGAALAGLGRGTAAQGTCVRVGEGCDANADCCPGARCANNGTCRCREGRTACGDKRCVNLNTDENNCGECGFLCLGKTCCTGACVDPQTDRANCGACGTACPSGQRCCAGHCADIRNDADHCGNCDDPCPPDPNGTVFCRFSICQLSCNDGFRRCGGRCIPNGDCCVDSQCGTGQRCCAGTCADVLSDEANCGACGRVCPATDVCQQADCCRPLGVACAGQDDFCCSGVCGRGGNSTCQCPPGQVDDNGACREANPGELPTSERCNPDNSGQCDSGICGCNGDDLCTCRLSPCAAPGRSCADGGNARCCAGVCQLAAGRACSCPAGQRPCDGACIRNGACCDADCSGGQVCQDGACACPGNRPTDCDGQCVNLQSDKLNCGRCGNACPAQATCRIGACICPDGRPSCGAKCCTAAQVCRSPFGRPVGCAQCDRGFTACGDSCRNLDTDRNNCGRCGRVCRLGQTCQGGACV